MEMQNFMTIICQKYPSAPRYVVSLYEERMQNFSYMMRNFYLIHILAWGCILLFYN